MYRSCVRSLASLSILVGALALAPGRVAAADGSTASLGPLEQVKASVVRVLPSGQGWPLGSAERYTEIVRVTHTLVDLDEMARRALGQHWQGLSRIEQSARTAWRRGFS